MIKVGGALLKIKVNIRKRFIFLSVFLILRKTCLLLDKPLWAAPAPPTD